VKAGLNVSKSRRTYTGHRAAAWSGGAIIGGIIAVIVLGFVVYEVTKIVTHAAGKTRRSVICPTRAAQT
jgi:hypothetical protein